MNFTFYQLILIIALLFVQNLIFTFVSRSRNSGNVWFHGPFALMSNSIWFVINYIFLFPELIRMVGESDTSGQLLLAILYTVPTTIGSMVAMWIAMRYLEKNKNRVGGDHLTKIEERLKKIEDVGYFVVGQDSTIIDTHHGKKDNDTDIKKHVRRRRANR